MTSTSDNLDGEISGELGISGNLSSSATGTAGGLAAGSGSFTPPNFEQGPTPDEPTEPKK